jgi:hypothetical protein
LPIEEPETDKVLVEVVDIFGNEAMKMLEVQVSHD